MADDQQAYEEEVDCLRVTLREHQETLRRLSNTLNDHLQLHITRHHMLHAALRDIVAVHSVPVDIAEKISNGGGDGDVESFDARVRLGRAQELIELITQELANVERTINLKQSLRDLRVLDGYAQLERDRDGKVLDKLKERIVFLEEWILRLSADLPSHVQSKKIRH
ncbi:hypothetical protein [Caballeronia sp. M23-90]